MKVSGIYMIKNIVNNKVYIGKSENCYGRWLTHRSNYKKQNTPLYNDMREYGIENFIFRILEKIPAYLMESREKKYIMKYNSFIPNGYNKKD